MGAPFTHTTWQVKPGQEEEFVRRWLEWVEWSHRLGLRAQARLLRDLEHPSTFVSFGPWETIAAVRGPARHHRTIRSTTDSTIARLAPLTATRCVMPVARKSSATSGARWDVSPSTRPGSRPPELAGAQS